VSKPASVTAVHCWRCGASTFYALLPVTPRMEILLDLEPVDTGTHWVDGNGFAREVRMLYLDGEPRYMPHARTCTALEAL